MSLDALRSPLRRHLAWLLGLALLLPVAQTLAGWHQLSHVAAVVGAADDGHRGPASTPDATPCELCLAAAALGGAALLALPANPLPPALPAATPLALPGPVWLASFERRYLSRGPPNPVH